MLFYPFLGGRNFSLRWLIFIWIGWASEVQVCQIFLDASLWSFLTAQNLVNLGHPIYFAPKKKGISSGFKKSEFNEIIPNSTASQMGMDDLTFTATFSLRCIRSTSESLPERHGSRLRQCSREKPAVQDSAGGRKFQIDSFFLLWVPKVTFFRTKMKMDLARDEEGA